MVCQVIGDRWHERWSARWLTSNRVSLGELILLILVECIDSGSLELASGHVLGEEDIEFVEGSVLSLGKSEECPDEDDSGASTPDEANIASHIPSCGVNHVVLECSTNNTTDVVCVSGEADSLLSETSGANFGGESPTQLTGGELEGERPDESKDGLSPCDARVVRPDVEDTDKDKLDSHSSHTPDVDCAATEVRHEHEPIAEAAEVGETISSDTERVGLLGVKTDLLEEVCLGTR